MESTIPTMTLSLLWKRLRKVLRTPAKLNGNTEIPYHQNIIELYHGLVLYRNLKTTLTPQPHAPTSAVHDHSKLEPLFYNGEKDATRAEEYRRIQVTHG